MEIVIDIEDYDREWIANGYHIPNEINGKIAEAIINGAPLPEQQLRDYKKCFICGKEIQRDSIPRIEPKLNKIMFGKDMEEHIVCNTCGNLLTIMVRIKEENE